MYCSINTFDAEGQRITVSVKRWLVQLGLGDLVRRVMEGEEVHLDHAMKKFQLRMPTKYGWSSPSDSKTRSPMGVWTFCGNLCHGCFALLTCSNILRTCWKLSLSGKALWAYAKPCGRILRSCSSLGRDVSLHSSFFASKATRILRSSFYPFILSINLKPFPFCSVYKAGDVPGIRKGILEFVGQHAHFVKGPSKSQARWKI